MPNSNYTIKFNPNFRKFVDSEIQRRLAIVGQGMRDRVVTNLSMGATRVDGPSLPGEMPHVDTGTLRRSIFWKFIDKFTVQIGSPLLYAKYLEGGTKRMAARPFLLPTLMAARSWIQSIFARGGK